uniref:Uncharacterized protein n=1 Tax=Coccolithus braarudii TaxID=221442 RepID=A0A7S0LGM2_9EUKA
MRAEQPANAAPTKQPRVEVDPFEAAAATLTKTHSFGPFSEYIIIGAGPGGMQLGALMESAALDYRIVERGSGPGTFWERHPRHEQLISLNKRFTSRTGAEHAEFNWRHDWNSLLPPVGAVGSPRFSDFSKEMFPARKDYLQYLRAYHRFYDLKVQFEFDVTTIGRRSIDGHEGFVLRSSTKRLQATCNYLIVATALGRPHVPAVPGIELAEGYEHVDVAEEAYTDQRVLVLGLGNAAFETATRAQNTAGYVHMVGRSHGGLKQSYFTHYVGDLRSINNNILDTFFLKSLDTVDVEVDLEKLNCSLTKRSLEGKDEIVFSCDGAKNNPSYREGYDRVIRCLGWVFDDRMFEPEVKPLLNRDFGRLGGKYPALKDTYESANVPNLFFAGTLSHAHDYKKSAGGFVHGFRYTARALFRMMQLNHRGVRWEAQRQLSSSAIDVAKAVQARFQSSSGLYQMFGELCDVVLVSKGDTATYMEEAPLRFIMNSAFPPNLRLVLTMHMDYGNKGHNGKGDLSFATREVGRAHYSQFLHPIIRAYLPSAKRGGLPSLVSEFHILEDLLTTWDVPEMHLQPLVEWISRVYLGDLASQEELLAHRFDELRANLTEGERSSGAKKFDAYFGSFTFPPSHASATAASI